MKDEGGRLRALQGAEGCLAMFKWWRLGGFSS